MKLQVLNAKQIIQTAIQNDLSCLNSQLIISYIKRQMPPKRTDPEAAKKEFELWKETQQYKKIEQVHKQLKSLPSISETSKDSDLSGKFQTLWDQIYQYANVIKVRPPFKRIQHEWIRSIYFGQKKKQKAPFCTYDGNLCEHENTEADSQYNLRQVFIKRIYNFFQDIGSLDESNYIKAKSEVKKAYGEFFKMMKAHLKKSHKIIYEQKLTGQFLQPLINMLEINMKLVMFDIKYQTPDEKIINYFKYKAFTQKYCVCLQQCMKILSEFHEKPIKFTPDVRMIFKKLEYTNLSKIQIFYLEPLRQSLQKMKRGLASLFTTGVNFWKVPLQANTKFVEDLKIVIKWELITQRLFGNDLLRDQINFISDTLGIIYKANPLAEKYLLQEDPNSIQIAVPKLVAFRTVEHMRRILDTKQKQKFEKEQRTIQLPIEKIELEEKKSATLNKTALSKISQELKKNQIAEQKRLQAQQRKKYGRYWLWTNYCDQDHKRLFERCAEDLKHINKAVHQDIQDSIIRQGMLPKRDRQNQQLKEAAEILKNMKTADNAQKVQNMKRPPELWNFNKVIEEEHKFRSIADPKKSYIDGRIEQLDKHLTQLAVHLKTKNKQDWTEMIKRTVNFYQNHHDPQPHF